MAARVARVLPPLLALLLVVSLAAPVGAQRAVLSQNGPGVAPATLLLDLHTGQTTTLSNDLTDRAVFSSDGTVLLRHVSGERHWRARFLASGAELPLVATLPPEISSLTSFIAHPRELASFTRAGYFDGSVRPARLDASGLHSWRRWCRSNLPDRFQKCSFRATAVT